jgi:hypothetical protein
MNRPLWMSLVVVVFAGVLATALLAVAGDGHEHEIKAEKVTVEGILVDTKCYGMNPENWAATHMTPKGKMPNCAQACANMGIPVGVLEDGKPGNDVYMLVTPAPALADHMARTVKVEGTVAYPHGIIPERLWVKNDDGKWEEVKIATMM